MCAGFKPGSKFNSGLAARCSGPDITVAFELVVQIQSELGEGHVNVIKAKEALLTEAHLCLVMEYAACGSLTGFVAERWQNAQQTGLFLQEDEARYFFRVRACCRT